jgi:hypothetical protein
MVKSNSHLNKNGTSTILLIFEVVVVILVGYIVFNVSTVFATSQGVLQINAAEDLSVMVNTLIATPSNALVEYQANMAPFRIALNSNQLFIEQEDEFSRVVRSIRLPQGYSASTQNGILNNIERVCLEKKDKTITLKGCTDES